MSNEKIYYVFSREPTGDLYFQLLDASVNFCESAILVVRHTIPFSERAERALEVLAPFLIEKAEETGWPGTMLVPGETGLVHRYRVEPEFLSAMKVISSRLYEWIQPELPEDLCFFRQDGHPWLVTTAHEDFAYLELSAAEHQQFVEQAPEFKSILLETA